MRRRATSILISHDDRIYSPRIAAQAEVAGKFGDMLIVAADVEMSSADHAITASRPLPYWASCGLIS